MLPYVFSLHALMPKIESIQNRDLWPKSNPNRIEIGIIIL